MDNLYSSTIINLFFFQIFEEVRMTTDTDIERNIELFLPILFEKLPDKSMFISGKAILSYF